MSLRTHNDNRNLRNLQLADEFFPLQRVSYSPGCITAAVGQVYNVGAQFDIGFKYKLQLAPGALQEGDGEEEEELEEEDADEEEDTDTDTNTLTQTEEEIEAGEGISSDSGVALVLYTAQQVLEKRIQDYLQEKLLYCPGSTDQVRDLKIDGVSVDLASLGEDGCDDETLKSCIMNGRITIYQRFNNAMSSSLQSSQAGLEALRVGMNEENAFEDVEDGGYIVNVGFLGGVVGMKREGMKSAGRGRDIVVSLGDGAVDVASIINNSYSFIQTKGNSLSSAGQGIVAVFVVTLLALVVARRRERARYARNVIAAKREGDLDSESDLSNDDGEDSWIEGGFVADSDEEQSAGGDHMEELRENHQMESSIEVYYVDRNRAALARLFGGYPRKSKQKECIDMSGPEA